MKLNPQNQEKKMNKNMLSFLILRALMLSWMKKEVDIKQSHNILTVINQILLSFEMIFSIFYFSLFFNSFYLNFNY